MAGRYEELAAICAPLITFTGLPMGDAQTGQELSLRVRPFGIFPSMANQIDIVLRDDEALVLESRERGALIKRWDHRIEVTPTPAGAQLTDRIHIDAGWLTLAVTAWAWVFYRHRHRRRQARVAQSHQVCGDRGMP